MFGKKVVCPPPAKGGCGAKGQQRLNPKDAGQKKDTHNGMQHRGKPVAKTSWW